MKYLPKIPSKLIRLALRDLKKREADPRYVIEMDSWHTPSSYDGRCKVCFAGATFAGLGVGCQTAASDGSFGPVNRRRFWALNDFRQGFLEAGLHSLGIKHPANFPRLIQVASYDRSAPEIFHGAMEKLAARFEKRGL